MIGRSEWDAVWPSEISIAFGLVCRSQGEVKPRDPKKGGLDEPAPLSSQP